MHLYGPRITTFWMWYFFVSPSPDSQEKRGFFLVLYFSEGKGFLFVFPKWQCGFQSSHRKTRHFQSMRWKNKTTKNMAFRWSIRITHNSQIKNLNDLLAHQLTRRKSNTWNARDVYIIVFFFIFNRDMCYTIDVPGHPYTKKSAQ